jgi:hypothetical protein
MNGSNNERKSGDPRTSTIHPITNAISAHIAQVHPFPGGLSAVVTELLPTLQPVDQPLNPPLPLRLSSLLSSVLRNCAELVAHSPEPIKDAAAIARGHFNEPWMRQKL